jgi:hypothetical protein
LSRIGIPAPDEGDKVDDLDLKTVGVDIAEAWLIEDSAAASFGGEDVVAQLRHDYEVRLGNRPFVRSMRRLYEEGGRQLPPDIAALNGETYIITHGLGVNVVDGKARKIDKIGYRASFRGAGSTIELLPNTRFREYISVGGKLEVQIGADGYVKTPPVKMAVSQVLQLGAGVELSLATDAKVVGQVSFSVKSVEIQAVGSASSTATWQLDRADYPLVGDQQFLQTIVAPRGQESLEFELQGFAVIDASLFRRPVRVQTETLTVELALEE